VSNTMRSVAPSDPNDPFDDIPSMAAAAAQRRPQHPALIFEERTLLWGEFDRQASQVANRLIELGLRPTEKVAILSHTCPEYVVLYLGTLRAGGCVVPLSSMATGESLEMMINDCDARVLLVAEAMRPAIAGFSERLGNIVPGGWLSVDFEEEGYTRFDRWIEGASATSPNVPIEPDYPFNIIYSSGTTGMPKGILHDHRMRYRQVNRMVNYGMGEDSIALVSTPYYSNTTLITALTMIAKGGTQVLMRKFDVEKFLQLSERYRVTHAMLVPVQYQRILAHPEFDKYDLSSYQAKLSTSAPLRGKVIREALDRWPGNVYEIYGLTEGGFSSVLDGAAFPDKLDSVGRPNPGAELRIIDENGKELPPGEIGEITGRSGAMMVGYYKRPDLTEELFWKSPEGDIFFRTGDLGKLDEDGFLYLLDRKKDMIISGGFNIYASDLEQVLLKHEAVADVAVIGIPSEHWGETPLALVVLAPGASADEQQILEWANERLGKGQRLAGVEFRDSLPRSSIGKVLKRELREPYWKE
jgi:long-chain acyl-CoA synthetase